MFHIKYQRYTNRTSSWIVTYKRCLAFIGALSVSDDEDLLVNIVRVCFLVNKLKLHILIIFIKYKYIRPLRKQEVFASG